MTKYLIFILASLYSLFLGVTLTDLSYVSLGNYTFLFEFIAPLLLVISAINFFKEKLQHAGIIGLIGVVFSIKEILIWWLPVIVNFRLWHVLFLFLTTLFYGLLAYISIESIKYPVNSKRFEFINYNISSDKVRIISVITLGVFLVLVITICTYILLI